MKIRIGQKYTPFSHLPGTVCILPGSFYQVRVFPVRLELENLLEKGSLCCIELDLNGPVSNFTVVQDLEKQGIRVFGNFCEGFFSYRICISEEGLALVIERCPEKGMTVIEEKGKSFSLRRKEQYVFPLACQELSSGLGERISFGIHKMQDWELIKRRSNLGEILPLWFQLGQLYPKDNRIEVGNYQLLALCEELFVRKERSKIGPALLSLFRAGFSGLFVPRVSDAEYQGFYRKKEPFISNISPFMLLKGGADLIRALFFRKIGESYEILPCLPIELHAGRFIGIQEDDLSLDLEWSKKRIKKLFFSSKEDRKCVFWFPSAVKSFRLRSSFKEKGERYSSSTPLFIKARRSYFLDRFER